MQHNNNWRRFYNRKPIEIEAFDLGVIRDVVVSPIKFNETSWMVDTVCHIEYSQVNHLPHVVTGRLSLNNKDISISTTFSEGKIRDESTRNGYMYQAQFFLNNVSKIPVCTKNLIACNAKCNDPTITIYQVKFIYCL